MQIEFAKSGINVYSSRSKSFTRRPF